MLACAKMTCHPSINCVILQNEVMAAAAILASRYPKGSEKQGAYLDLYSLVADHCEHSYVRDKSAILSSEVPDATSVGALPGLISSLWLRAVSPDCSVSLPGLNGFVSESHYHVVGSMLDSAAAFEALALQP